MKHLRWPSDLARHWAERNRCERHWMGRDIRCRRSRSAGERNRRRPLNPVRLKLFRSGAQDDFPMVTTTDLRCRWWSTLISKTTLTAGRLGRGEHMQVPRSSSPGCMLLQTPATVARADSDGVRGSGSSEGADGHLFSGWPRRGRHLLRRQTHAIPYLHSIRMRLPAEQVNGMQAAGCSEAQHMPSRELPQLAPELTDARVPSHCSSEVGFYTWTLDRLFLINKKNYSECTVDARFWRLVIKCWGTVWSLDRLRFLTNLMHHTKITINHSAYLI